MGQLITVVRFTRRERHPRTTLIMVSVAPSMITGHVMISRPSARPPQQETRLAHRFTGC